MIKRKISKELIDLSGQYPVITITGPRQTGKTTLCQAIFPDYQYVNLEDLTQRAFAQDDPEAFLDQWATPIILDEIQRVPELLSSIQLRVDNDQQPGQYILTGSHSFEMMESINQSLAGRTAVVKLLPLAYEEVYQAGSTIIVDEIIFRGFYPRIHQKQLNPTQAYSFYCSTYLEKDIRSLAQIQNLRNFERFLRLCATQVGQLVNYSRLASDSGVNQKTVQHWLTILEASYIVYTLQPIWSNARKRLTQTPKLYFYDTGLACYLLGLQNAQHVQSHPLRGHLFENFIISEFMKNRTNQVLDSNLYFYRDQAGHEVDLVLDQGVSLVSLEIKAGKTLYPEAFHGLKYYGKLMGAKNQHKWLVYGGKEDKKHGEFMAYSYSNLSLCFKRLSEL